MAAQTLGPDTVIGGYRLEHKLGEGAMGVVYLASPVAGGDPVAIKVLKRDLAVDDVYRHRFEHEVRAARGVSHPAVVPVLDAGEDGERHYLVMAYFPGRTLRQRITDEGPFEPDALVAMISQIAGALDALHAAGLIHRDVKPSNILIDDGGTAALTDFGIARGHAYTVLTRPGQVLGTLDYMAPEIIRGDAASTSSDIYALGCVCYECATGEAPFAHKSAFQVGVAHLSESPPDPRERRPDLPPGLSRAILKALLKEPDRRPATCLAYADLLKTVLGLTGHR